MEYLVPALAMLAIGALTLVVANGMARRARAGAPTAPASPHGSEVSEARARDAVALLDEAGHRAVYGHIAQSRLLEAVKAYRRLTGRSLRDGALDVQSLALHPQVWTPRPAPEAQETDARPESPGRAAQAAGPASDASGREAPDAPRAPGDTDGAPPAPRAGARTDGRPATGGSHAAPHAAEEGPASAPAEPAGAEGIPEAESEPLMVPSEWLAEPAPEEAPFEVEVLRGGGSIHVSSRDLPPWLRDQLAAMVRDGNLESAAVQLSTHSELTVPEAFELLRSMRDRREGQGG